MTDQEAKKDFLKQLRKKVPNRDVCREATKEQIVRIMKEVDFGFCEKVCENSILKLTPTNIPKEFVFEMILYVLSTSEWEGDTLIAWYRDPQLFNLEDKEMRDSIDAIKKMFKIPKSGYLTQLKLDRFLEYAKSKDPDIESFFEGD